MKATRRRMILNKEQCKAVRDWFAFVDQPQRTDVDSRFNHKITERLRITDATQFYLTEREAQLATRWFHLLPSVVCDQLDNDIHRLMEDFLEG